MKEYRAVDVFPYMQRVYALRNNSRLQTRMQLEHWHDIRVDFTISDDRWSQDEKFRLELAQIKEDLRLKGTPENKALLRQLEECGCHIDPLATLAGGAILMLLVSTRGESRVNLSTLDRVLLKESPKYISVLHAHGSDLNGYWVYTNNSNASESVQNWVHRNSALRGMKFEGDKLAYERYSATIVVACNPLAEILEPGCGVTPVFYAKNSFGMINKPYTTIARPRKLAVKNV